ncbi:MAG: hypothetical protein QGD89_08145 [Actinomycetota bacterium]|nr:hypothetical protein [Actinomycetota bacterium]
MYAEAYRRGHSRVVAFMEGRDPEISVPATPLWGALDILRHLTGISADISDHIFDGFASDEWTRQQVESRRHLSAEEVVGEWNDVIGPASELLDTISEMGLPETIASAAGLTSIKAVPPMAIGDILHHEFDLRNAYGDTQGRDLLDLHFSASGHVKSLRGTFSVLGLPTIRVESTDAGMGWDVGFDEPVATLRASSFELMRGIGGRRTREEMGAMGWAGDPEPFLDSMVLPHLAMRETSLRE